MKEIHSNGTGSEVHPRTQGPQMGMAIAVLMVGVVLAILSLVEFAFPKIKWFTTPAMGVAIALLVAVGLFRRMRWFVKFTQWLISSLRGTRSKEETLESLGPPE